MLNHFFLGGGDLLNLFLGQEIRVLLIRVLQQGVLRPEIGSEVSVGSTKGVEDSLDEVSHGTGVTTRGRVAIIDTGHVHQLFARGRRHESGTTGSRDQTNTDRTTLSGHLAGDGMGQSGDTSPISTSDGSHVELGSGDGTTNGGSDFGRAFDAQTNVSVGISDGNKGLESGALTGGRLLLDGHDFHDLVLELVLQEVVDNFGFLDRDGEEEDLFDGGDLSFLDQTSKLGDGDPDVLVTSSSASASSASTTSAASTAASSASESSSSFLWGVVTHLDRI